MRIISEALHVAVRAMIEDKDSRLLSGMDILCSCDVCNVMAIKGEIDSRLRTVRESLDLEI